MEQIAKVLTDQFYAWEKRGRGVVLSPYPCELEPPFHPFFYHYHNTKYIDDGRRPTLISTAFDFLKGKKQPKISLPHHSDPPILPLPIEDETLHAFTIVLPRGFKTPVEGFVQLLIMLANCRHPLAYEIKASHITVSIHLVCSTKDKQLIRSQCRAYFPEITLHDDTNYIANTLQPDTLTGIVDFSLAEEFTRPIQSGKGFDLDPYISLFGILEDLKANETALFQVQFVQTKRPWSKSILSSVSTYRGECFFMDAPEMLPLAKEKVSMPLFAVAVKIAVQAKSDKRIHELLNQTSECITMLSRSGNNSLRVRHDDEYAFEDRLTDITARQTHRLGMLLNVRELATLAHFPSASIHCNKLLRSVTKTKAAPAFVQNQQFILGTNRHQSSEVKVSISEQQRMRHIHIIGATGTGKSTLLLNLIYQDLIDGNGIAIIDPHGDLIETILTIMPAKRKNDVVIIDPFDSNFPVKCNILHAQTDIEKELISSDLVALFRRFSTSWGDQMNSVFANAILAFVESTKGGTLLDLQKFLIEKTYRDAFLQTVQDPQVVYYWQKEFPLLKSSSIGPILTKLDAFLRPKVIRNMVSQKESLPIADLMDTRKIILIKLSQGLIGAENSYLLGALLVSKIHQAAMARQLRAHSQRVPFFLYIDEFQHFITPSMSDILSGARKYQLGLVLVHQSMEQVTKYDNELAHALLANAGTRICFRLGNADGKKMEEGLSFFTSADLQNLAIGEAIVRVNRSEDDFSMQVHQENFPANLQIVRDEILAQSRKKYTAPLETLKQSEPASVVQREPQKPEEVVPEPQPDVKKSEEPNKTNATEKEKKNPGEAKEQKAQLEHKSLQIMIKLLGESRGFKATLEVPAADKGKIDVVLEKDTLKIACEVSVTTDVAWEVHNLQKCLRENYTTIISISKNQRFLTGMKKKALEVFTEQEQKRILILTPDNVAAYLDELTKGSDTTMSVKGYRVKVTYSQSSENAAEIKRDLLKNISKTKK